MKGVSFTVEELEPRSGVQARTLRSWIREKVLQKPMGRGRGARYDERHVVRAVVARQLRSTKLSLSAIRTRLASMSESELVALAQGEARARSVSVDGVPAPPPAPSYPSTAWEVVSLMDGLVLMVSTTKGPLVRRVADEIYRYYGSPT
jgi:DNA-binding transcriptional MerR regulator